MKQKAHQAETSDDTQSFITGGTPVVNARDKKVAAKVDQNWLSKLGNLFNLSYLQENSSSEMIQHTMKFIKESVGCSKDIMLFITKKRLGKLIGKDMSDSHRKKYLK